MPFKLSESRFQRWAQGNFKKSLSKSQSIEIPHNENSHLNQGQSIESSLHNMEVYGDEMSAQSFAEKRKKFQNFHSPSNDRRGTLIYGTLPKSTRFSMQPPTKQSSRESPFTKFFLTRDRKMSQLDSQQTSTDVDLSSLSKKPTRSILKSSSYRQDHLNSASIPLASAFYKGNSGAFSDYGTMEDYVTIENGSSNEQQCTSFSNRGSHEKDEPIEVCCVLIDLYEQL